MRLPSRLGNNGLRMRILLLAALSLPALSQASPRLQCEIAEGGDSKLIEAVPAAEPYQARAVDLNRHFRFKAVVVGSESHVDYVKLYVYYWSARQPVLLQEARYLLPAVRNDPAPDALTGTQYLYSPELGYEMQYRCALRETMP